MSRILNIISIVAPVDPAGAAALAAEFRDVHTKCWPDEFTLPLKQVAALVTRIAPIDPLLAAHLIFEYHQDSKEQLRHEFVFPLFLPLVDRIEPRRLMPFAVRILDDLETELHLPTSTSHLRIPAAAAATRKVLGRLSHTFPGDIGAIKAELDAELPGNPVLAQVFQGLIPRRPQLKRASRKTNRNALD